MTHAMRSARSEAEIDRATYVGKVAACCQHPDRASSRFRLPWMKNGGLGQPYQHPAFVAIVLLTAARSRACRPFHRPGLRPPARPGPCPDLSPDQGLPG